MQVGEIGWLIARGTLMDWGPVSSLSSGWTTLKSVTFLVAFQVAFCAATVRAQAPSVGPLTIVALDEDNNAPAREPAVAVASPDLALCAYNDSGLHFSVWDGVSWSQLPYTHAGGDPSVAYDAIANQFIICSFVGGAAGGVNLDRYDVATGAFAPLQTVVSGGTDKPWLVLGESQGVSQELYFVYKEAGGSGFGGQPKFGRSTDSGQTWIFGDAPGGGGFAIQASVATTGSSPLFVAFPDTIAGIGSGYALEEGTDTPGGGVSFAPLLDAAGQRILVQSLNSNGSLGGQIPGPSTAKTLPYLVADPSNGDRVYVLYHDNQVGPNDVDVWCARLDRAPSTGAWSITQNVRVNDDPLVPGDDRDQFQPAAIVDGQGRVHVVFYDDRRYTQADSDPTLTAKFDAYYAYSLDGGSTFANVRINRIINEPVMDFAILGESLPQLQPGEYPGIAVKNDVVVLTMAGTWSLSPNSKKSVIWGCIVTF